MAAFVSDKFLKLVISIIVEMSGRKNNKRKDDSDSRAQNKKAKTSKKEEDDTFPTFGGVLVTKAGKSYTHRELKAMNVDDFQGAIGNKREINCKFFVEEANSLKSFIANDKEENGVRTLMLCILYNPINHLIGVV